MRHVEKISALNAGSQVRLAFEGGKRKWEKTKVEYMGQSPRYLGKYRKVPKIKVSRKASQKFSKIINII